MLKILAIILLALFIGPSCKTAEDGTRTVDWQVWSNELQLVELDLRSFADVSDFPGDPEKLIAFADALMVVNVKLAGWIDSGEEASSMLVYDAVEAALEIGKDFVGDDSMIWIAIANSALRRFQLYLPARGMDYPSACSSPR